jgi:hypothetical protein
VIIISGHYHGPELKDSKVWAALSSARKYIDKQRDSNDLWSYGATPHVNAVFFVEGSLGGPDFHDEVHMGPYSRMNKCLQVNLIITQAEANGQNLREVIVDRLRGANANAFHFFDDKGLEFPLREAEALVTKVGEALSDFV